MKSYFNKNSHDGLIKRSFIPLLSCENKADISNELHRSEISDTHCKGQRRFHIMLFHLFSVHTLPSSYLHKDTHPPDIFPRTYISIRSMRDTPFHFQKMHPDQSSRLKKKNRRQKDQSRFGSWNGERICKTVSLKKKLYPTSSYLLWANCVNYSICS